MTTPTIAGTPTGASCFCGLADDYTSLGEPYPADLAVLPVWIQTPSDEVIPPVVVQEVKRGLAVWQPYVPFEIVVVTEQPAAQPYITLRFVRGDHGDSQPFDGQGNVIGHATPPPAPGWMHLDEDETWHIEGWPEYDGQFELAVVVGHEGGHNFGMGHGGVPGALMFPRYQGHTLALAPDDIAGIQALYPPEGGTDLPQPPATFWGETPTIVMPDGRLLAATVVQGTEVGTPTFVMAEWVPDQPIWSLQLEGSGKQVEFRLWAGSDADRLDIGTAWHSDGFVAHPGALARVSLMLPALAFTTPTPEPTPAKLVRIRIPEMTITAEVLSDG